MDEQVIQPVSSIQPFQDGPKGIGGFLLFYSIVIGFFGSLLLIGSLILEVDEELDMTAHIYIALLGILYLTTLYFIIRKKQIGRALAILASLLTFSMPWLLYFIFSQRVKNTLIE